MTYIWVKALAKKCLLLRSLVYSIMSPYLRKKDKQKKRSVQTKQILVEK